MINLASYERLLLKPKRDYRRKANTANMAVTRVTWQTLLAIGSEQKLPMNRSMQSVEI